MSAERTECSILAALLIYIIAMERERGACICICLFSTRVLGGLFTAILITSLSYAISGQSFLFAALLVPSWPFLALLGSSWLHIVLSPRVVLEKSIESARNKSSRKVDSSTRLQVDLLP